MASAERRIILLGNTGSGKSSTGNSLLGYQAFDECRNRPSETRVCKFWKCFINEGNVSYGFVDTPGFINNHGYLTENLLEIQRSTEICPDPHAFLLVFSPPDISDEEYVYTVDDLLRVAFGKQVFDHCIVIFTHGNKFCTEVEFTQFWQTSKALVKLIESCGGRILRVENKPTTKYSRQDGVHRVYDAVEDGVNREYEAVEDGENRVYYAVEDGITHVYDAGENGKTHVYDAVEDGVDIVYDAIEKMSDSGRNQYNCKITKSYKNILEECLSKNKGQTCMQQIATLVHAIDLKNQQFEGKEAKNEEKRKIVLVGKSGNGKSATGNTLLGRQIFNAVRSPSSVTQKCRLEENKYSTNKVLYSFTVVDTPGLMDTDVPLAKRLLQLQESVVFCPQPHAFLLIFSSTARMTKDEEYTVDLLRVAFGEKVFDHCIVVFTHGNVFQTDQEFKNYWQQSQLLVDLVKRCGGRIVRVANDSSVNPENNEHVKQIIETMEKMSIGGKKTYDYDYIDTHKNVIKEHFKRYKGPLDYQMELSFLVNDIGKHLRTNVWNRMLVGGTIIVATACCVALSASIHAAPEVVAAGQRVVEVAKSPTVRQYVVNGVYAAGSGISSAAASLASKFLKK